MKKFASTGCAANPELFLMQRYKKWITLIFTRMISAFRWTGAHYFAVAVSERWAVAKGREQNFFFFVKGNLQHSSFSSFPGSLSLCDAATPAWTSVRRRILYQPRSSCSPVVVVLSFCVLPRKRMARNDKDVVMWTQDVCIYLYLTDLSVCLRAPLCILLCALLFIFFKVIR